MRRSKNGFRRRFNSLLPPSRRSKKRAKPTRNFQLESLEERHLLTALTTISLSPTVQWGTEVSGGGGQVGFTLNFSDFDDHDNEPHEAIPVEFTYGGTANRFQGPLPDYYAYSGDRLFSGYFWIDEGETSVFVPLNIQDDSVVEGTETIIITLIRPYPINSYAIGGSGSVTLLINDNDLSSTNSSVFAPQGSHGIGSPLDIIANLPTAGSSNPSAQLNAGSAAHRAANGIA